MKFDYGDLVVVISPAEDEFWGKTGIVVMVDNDDNDFPYGVAFGVPENALNLEELRIEDANDIGVFDRSWHKQCDDDWGWYKGYELELQAPEDDIVLAGDINLSLLLG